nr:hypothetical protein [Tanacetum cinerariifolium]
MGKGLFGPNGRRGRKVEVGLENFEGEEIRNYGGNGGRGSSIFRRGGGSLAICSMESKDVLGGGGLVVVGARSSSVSKIAWGEVGGVENKSLMGSMLIAKGEECLDGWVRSGGGEVKVLLVLTVLFTEQNQLCKPMEPAAAAVGRFSVCLYVPMLEV